MKKTPEQQFKLAISAVLIALLVLVTGFAVVYKKNQQELLQKDLKISVLIDEVGQVKDQNEKMYQYFVSEKDNIQNTTSQLGDLSQKLNEVDIDTAKQKQIQQDLAVANSNLRNLIDKKDQTIESLQQKNSLIAQNIPNSGKLPGFLNVLVLGENMGLTDTIMLASINTVAKKVTLLSIPRDLYYNGRKINEYYEKYGIGELENVINAVTGIMPDKYLIVDMSSFVAVVDAVGGVDINVPKGITDALYPGPNSTYATVSFKQGYQHMDGQRALKYARSRKSTTDFDRSARQQQIITALKQKAEELDLKDDITKLTEMYNSVKDGIKTDVSLLDALNYYSQYRTFQINSGNVISNQNYLYSTYNSVGQYILLPYKSSYVPLQNYVKKLVGA